MKPRRRTDYALKKGASFLFLLFALSLTQCRLQPRGVMATKELKAVVRDMLLLDGSMPYNRQQNDSLYKLAQEAVFDKHGITRAEYDSSMIWYAENAQLLTTIYDELEAEFKEKGALLDSAIVDSTELYRLRYVQATSLWNSSSRFVIPRKNAYYYRSQTLHGIVPGDTIDFKASILPPLDGSQEIELTLFLKDSSDVVRHKETALLRPGDRGATSFIIPKAPHYETKGRKVWEFYFLYRNPEATRDTMPGFPLITFDSVVLFRRVPPEPLPSVTDSVPELKAP